MPTKKKDAPPAGVEVTGPVRVNIETATEAIEQLQRQLATLQAVRQNALMLARDILIDEGLLTSGIDYTFDFRRFAFVPAPVESAQNGTDEV